MENARSVKRGFSPLDRELGLLNGELTPQLQQSVARLGTWMPFRRAAEEIKHFTGTEVSEATVRRVTEQAGKALIAVQTKDVERLEREMPQSPAGPELQLMSVDGAMVPLVNKEWAEVKTLAIGVVQKPRLEKGKKVVHTTELSYFSRVAEASEYSKQALYEVHRRGTEKAGKVCAVTDGAEWEQGFMDYHRSDAIRILDFAHGAERLAAAGRAIHGESTPRFEQWFGQQRHALKGGKVTEVLGELGKLSRKAKRDGFAEKLEVIEGHLNYLEKRRSMIEYGKFQRKGYPIGSGTVESANKVVVQSRLKQAGMHWARPNVNPMLALRNVACNQRWDEAWAGIVENKQELVVAKFRQRRDRKIPSQTATKESTTPSPLIARKAVTQAIDHKKNLEEINVQKRPYRPAADHPWRRMRFGRTSNRISSAKN